MRALISVFDKSGIVEFAKGLADLGIEIIATSGTAKLLKNHNIEIKEISEITKYPEILDGRVKTLHPTIFASLLCRKNDCVKYHIEPIDIVVVNLYNFFKKQCLENIDIGGVALIRAGAKNYKNVAVVTSPQDYLKILSELKAGSIKYATKKHLAYKAFEYVSAYDIAISEYFRTIPFPEILNLSFKKYYELRYGENPHQRGFLYTYAYGLANATQYGGKQLSYNNFLDLDTAINIVKMFKKPTVAIIKHTTPCGVACNTNLLQAYKLAYSTDPVSVFGSVIGVNKPVDIDLAKQLSNIFIECIIAPKYYNDALTILRKKKNLRILELDMKKCKTLIELRSIEGGILVQEKDIKKLAINRLKTVTKAKVNKSQLRSLIFAFYVSRFAKSNSLVFAKKEFTIGIASGQTSRVDAAKIVVAKYGAKLKGSYMASEAFIPFRDTIDVVGKYVNGIIQPGGSIRDKDVIEACNEYNIPMIFTRMRVFRH